jgi:hypothetical protein
VRPAHLVARVARQPRVVERHPPAAVAQPPQVRDLGLADREVVAGAVAVRAVLGVREDRPRPAADVRGQAPAGALPERRAPAPGPREQQRVGERAVHREDPPLAVEGHELVVVERDRPDVALEARRQRQALPRLLDPRLLRVGPEVEPALARGEQVAAVERLGRALERHPRRQVRRRVGGIARREPVAAVGQRADELLLLGLAAAERAGDAAVELGAVGVERALEDRIGERPRALLDEPDRVLRLGRCRGRRHEQRRDHADAPAAPHPGRLYQGEGAARVSCRAARRSARGWGRRSCRGSAG